MKEIDEIEDHRARRDDRRQGGHSRFADGQTEPRRGNYEIQTLDVYNGPVRTTHYFGSTLSPAGPPQLDALELRRRPPGLRPAPRPAHGRTASNAAPNRSTWPRSRRCRSRRRSPLPASRTPAPSPRSTHHSSPPTASAASGVDSAAASITARPWPSCPPCSTSPAPRPAVIEIPKNNETQSDLMKALREAQDTLAKSRQNTPRPPASAYSDNDGRIVAVRLDEK